MSNTTTANQSVKNNLLVVLGAAIIIGAFMGAIQVSSTNQQAGTLKSSVADKAISDTSTNRVIGGGTGQEKVLSPSGGPSFITQSLNGTTWNTIVWNAPFTGWVNHAVLFFHNNLYILGGNGSGADVNDIWKSADGINWNQVIPSGNMWSPRHALGGIVFQNKMWVIGGCFLAGPSIWNSTDGISWNPVTPNGSGQQIPTNCIDSTAVYDNQIWAFGDPNSSGSGLNLWKSPDGINWINVGSNLPLNQIGNYGTNPKLLSANGKLWWIGGNVYWTTDGITWTQSYSGGQLPIAQHIVYVLNNVMYTTGGFFAMTGTQPDTIFSSTDGITWNQTPMNFVWHPVYTDAAVVPKSFGCSIRSNAIPNTAQLNAGIHVKTYEFQVTTCANPVTLTQIDFNSSQSSSAIKRTNIKLETNNTTIAIPQPPVYTAAVYPIFKPNYTVPAYTTQTFTVTEDIGGSIVTGSSISSNLTKMTANFGSNTISWTNTFPLGMTTLIHP